MRGAMIKGFSVLAFSLITAVAPLFGEVGGASFWEAKSEGMADEKKEEESKAGQVVFTIDRKKLSREN
jgi:hypothetical protein